MHKEKVWYITGASKGLGIALVKKLLIKGQKVAATTRDLEALKKEISEKFSHLFLPLQVDLTSDISIANSMRAVIDKFERIDIVVNNAGYGIGGALEELSTEEIQRSFEVNFFAVIKVIQQAMPYLRKQRSGHIINISSIAGFAPGTGWSVYAAAKFAVSGLSEALANDLKPLGIQVTAVSPGWFRTSFAKLESIKLNKKQINDYEHIRESHKKFKAIDGNQIGDPDKVADALLKLTDSVEAPVNLFLGSDSFKRAFSKIETLTQEMKGWKEVSISTDF